MGPKPSAKSASWACRRWWRDTGVFHALFSVTSRRDRNVRNNTTLVDSGSVTQLSDPTEVTNKARQPERCSARNDLQQGYPKGGPGMEMRKFRFFCVILPGNVCTDLLGAGPPFP
eukprot:1339910-Amorphochlora_amoeboformis.AAC.1